MKTIRTETILKILFLIWNEYLIFSCVCRFILVPLVPSPSMVS